MLYLLTLLILTTVLLCYGLYNGCIEEFKDLKQTFVIYRLINDTLIADRELDETEENKTRYVVAYKDLFFVTDVSNINEIYNNIIDVHEKYTKDKQNTRTSNSMIIRNIEEKSDFLKEIYSTINRTNALYIDENNTKYGIQFTNKTHELIDLETGKKEVINEPKPDVMLKETEESKQLLSFYIFAKRDYDTNMMLSTSSPQTQTTLDGEYLSVPQKCKGDLCYGDLKGSSLDKVSTSGSYNEVYGIPQEDNESVVSDTSKEEIKTGGVSNASREEETITIPSVKELESKREKVDINAVRKELNLKPIDYDETLTIEDLKEEVNDIQKQEENRIVKQTSSNVLSLISPPSFEHDKTDFDKPGFYMSQDTALAMFSKLQQ